MRRIHLLTLGLVYLAASVSAQTLSWDAGNQGTNTGPGVMAASGNWNIAASNWFNGTNDQAWSQISSNTATAGITAVFGGVDGTYLITNAVQIAATNVAINNSGYTFSGFGIDLASGGLLAVAAGKSVAFGCNFVSGNNTENYWAGGGAIVSLAGNFGGQQPHLAGPTNCAYFLGGVNTPSVLFVNAPVYQTNGSITTSASFFIAYPTTVNGTNYTSGSLTLSGGAVATQNGGSLMVGRAGGVGTLTLLNGAVNVGVAGSTARSLAICNDGNGSEQGSVNVYGGSLNVGSVGNAILNGQISFLPGGSNLGETAMLTQTNGVINAWGGIQFGAASGTYSGGSATLTNLGGSLYLGPGGISLGAVYPPNCKILLSGGVVGALGNWASSLPMTLGTNNGSITFQCSDASGDAYGISLSGPLTGPGGLIKTGTGALTLMGTNTYAGATSLAQGALALTASAVGGGAYSVATNATLSFQSTTAGATLTVSALALAGGAALTLNSGVAGNPSAPLINVSGALTPAAPVRINVAGALTNGAFPLLKYGSLGGTGFSSFRLGSVSLPAGTSGTASLVNDTTNNSIDLNLTTYPAERLAWAGTINGNWDVGLTANWQTNAYYAETVSGGPMVVFDDTAAGPYTAVALNTNVAPSGITVSNSVLTYSISGQGGIGGIGGLLKAGTGLLTLGCVNTYSGGTTISSGTLALTTTNNAAMAYTNTGGTLSVNAASMNSSLAATSLTFGTNSPQLAFGLANFFELAVPLIYDSGNLNLDGNVLINVTNPMPGTNVLLQYAGTRSGAGSFLPGQLPPGATLTDNSTSKTVTLTYVPQPRVIIPKYGTNEIVVAMTTPQEFGAKGDGITDDSAAFQNAINWVYNSGHWGGGVIFVPAASYAFYTNLTIPQGVTLHGDWMDWTTGTNGMVGTTFKIYFGAGQTNAAPFIFMNSMTSLKDVNLWYPNQSPTNITGYPFSIQISGYCVLKNLVLVNAYQGIVGTAASDAPIHILSTVIGSPLYLGISLDMLADISETEDVRFSPSVWAASGATNAPAAGGSYAGWMRTNGTAMRLLRVDGELSMDTMISGYNVGIEANSSTNGAPGATFYEGFVTNCGTALLAQVMPSQSGLQFTDFTLDGDTAVNRTTNSNDATVGFDHCQIIGRKGTAVYAAGADWHSWIAFQNCTISNTLQLAGPGVFNVVDSSLSGATNCVLSSSATRAAFTGCTFSPATNIVNAGNAGNLLMESRQSISNALPVVHWTNVLNDYISRRPARTNLYVATSWGAAGNGVADDTATIQSALTAAGTNGGGIVYLPAGKYHLSGTLTVPSGVELRGVHEMRSGDGYWSDGKSKASVLEPYGGQGTTNGPAAVALEGNSGIVGVTFSYETQNSNCIPFPPTIQGRGANVYAIGVVCPNTYYYVDMDTYKCLNHLIYMVDGWVINTGFHIGNGSSGSIVDCQENNSYWVVNQDSASELQNEGLVNGYAATNAQMNILGNCTELMVKSFSINDNTFLHCVAENGCGPNVTAIGTCCDGTIQGYVLDAAAPSTINVVNTTMAIFSIVGQAMTNYTVGVISTTNFQGTARFFNSALFGGPEWDFVVGGGDVGFDLVHMLDHAFNGSSVSGGVLHLVNNGAYITYNGSNDFPPYNVAWGTNAGIAGQVSEYIGSYAYNGCSFANPKTNNPINIWQDYALSSYTELSKTNQFVQIPPVSPELSVQPAAAGQRMTISWPSNSGAFYLFATPSLTPPVAWTQVTNPVVYSNGAWWVSLPNNNAGNNYYRLEQ